MSIASEITRISNNVADAYTAASGKGATMPATQNSANLASTISTIQTGTTPVISSLNVTPTTSAQQITAPHGTDGYSPVNVSAVTSSIDANIVAGNIKKDVQILGVTGSYEGTTPTGTLNIPANGVYDVTNYASADVQVPTTAPAYYIDKTKDANNVLQAGTTLISLSGLSNVGDYGLAYAYYYNTNITGTIDLSWLVNASNTGSFMYAFSYSGITGVDLSNLETVSGNSALQSAFSGCTGLTGTLNLGKLKSITGSSNAMSLTFSSCTGITGVNLSSLEYITGSANQMFNNCSNLTSVDLSKFKFVGNGSSICSSMFQSCNITGSLDLSSLEAILAYQGCSNMFYNNYNITSVDLSSLVYTSSQGALQSAFNGCTSLASVDFSKLCKINSSNTFSQTFRNTSLTTLSFPNFAYANVNYNGAFANMLQGVTGCTVHFPAEWQTTMSSWSNVTAGFGGTNTTVLFDLPNVTTLDLSYITEIKFDSMFAAFAASNYFTNITSVDLSGLTTITANNGCSSMFTGYTGLTSVNLSSLTQINGNYACQQMFWNSTGITSVNLSSLTKIDGSNACYNMFSGCTGLTSIDLSSLKNVSKTTACQNMFINCTSLTSANLSSLEYVSKNDSSTLNSMFKGCSLLQTADFSSLIRMNGMCASYMFDSCTSLTNVKLDSLKQVSQQSCQNMCSGCVALSSLSFPALRTFSGGSYFVSMLSGVTGCTVHFPSNLSGTQGLDATIIGGTNTTVLFDLPATNILTGADTVEYERNPKYDTQTALAWRVKDSGTDDEPIIDWTPYYTNGTTDPQVGDTIYSDSACTVSVTTISSIA